MLSDSQKKFIYQNMPSTAEYLTENAVYPTGDDAIENHPHGSSSNYSCVDDDFPDEGDTYIYPPGVVGDFSKDIYTIGSGFGSGDITKVTVYCRVRKDQHSAGAHANFGIDIDGSEYTMGYFVPTGEWITYTKSWTANPHTAYDWNWNDIAKIKLLVQLQTPDTGRMMCTQLYMVITHTGKNISFRKRYANQWELEHNNDEEITYPVILLRYSTQDDAKNPLDERRWTDENSDDTVTIGYGAESKSRLIIDVVSPMVSVVGRTLAATRVTDMMANLIWKWLKRHVSRTDMSCNDVSDIVDLDNLMPGQNISRKRIIAFVVHNVITEKITTEQLTDVNYEVEIDD